MTDTKKLAELFRSISQNNLDVANKVSNEICDIEAKKGHINIARTLRGALHASGKGHSNTAAANNHVATSIPETIGLKKLNDCRKLREITLSSQSRKIINEVLLEYRYKEILNESKLLPRSKLLFYGPPGCGKTLTATSIANQLKLPAYLVKFDEIIGSYLGQTAARLRQVFSFVEQTPCVLILDEIDAIGRGRGNARDVGELDRVVVSLLQELEHTSAQGFLIATTNIPDELDRALWRRFDLSIEFEQPTQKQLKSFAKKLAKNRRYELSDQLLNMVSIATNFDECEKMVLNDIRRSIIAGR